MNDDPTRRMDAPGERRDEGFSNRSKALIALLVAAVIGLGVAVAVIASGDGEDDATPATEIAPAGEGTTTEENPTTDTTTNTDTEKTTTETTTETTTDDSGGVEAP